MKESRHNGRAGKNGVYNPKHNDRNFDISNSDHIDDDRARNNIYWDCYQGYRKADEYVEGLINFEEVEKRYYEENYGEYCRNQNARNIANRHPERNRTTEDIRLSDKTCPEETIIQIGNMSESIDHKLLVDIAEEYFERMDALYGSNYHIIDWALHIDEETPHIHERHVFDYENDYGEIVPRQEKAMGAMGIELPKPDKKEGRHNNRKMTFDKECRELLAQIAAEHGVVVDLTPTYGGREYMEKQDYIIAKQKEEIEEFTNEISTKQQELNEVTMKISDVEEFVKEVSDEAYRQAVELTTTKAEEIVGKIAIDEIVGVDKDLISSEGKYSKANVSFARSVLKALKDKIDSKVGIVGKKIREKLLDPPTMEKAKAGIEEKATISIKERLEAGKLKTDSQRKGTKAKTNEDIER